MLNGSASSSSLAVVLFEGVLRIDFRGEVVCKDDGPALAPPGRRPRRLGVCGILMSSATGDRCAPGSST